MDKRHQDRECFSAVNRNLFNNWGKEKYSSIEPVYGKRKRQKMLRDHNFPAIFSLLPSAVFNARKAVFA